jgi:starvation-inducible outer membrane lipoprotein
MKKIILLAAAAALVLGACASTSSQTYNKNDAMSSIMAAEHETARASNVGYEWRDTGKIIKQAQEAMKQGQYDKAVKLANKAKQQSTLAIQQQHEQANAGPRIN